MKNRNIIKKGLSWFLCFLMFLSATACGRQEHQVNEEQESEYYTVTYDLNYEGSVPETKSVKANTRITSYQATRSGYTLEGWYRTADCKDGDTFDFTSYIESDLTLYAKWTEIKNSVSVTFDLNYNGAGTVKVELEEGTPIREATIPVCERLGMEYSGWYTNAACTNVWDMTNPVNQDITLYAKYKYTNEVKRDSAGNILYNNVTVNFYIGSDLGTSKALNKLIEAFNAENEGEIKVVPVTKMKEKEDYALRFKQISGAVDNIGDNYTINAVYDLAGIKLNGNDWYKQASRNCYINGKMYSVPLLAGVPFIVYNKDMMATYNTSNRLPSDYNSYSNLLSKVYQGESKENGDFQSIVTHTGWTFKEAASYATFIQNGADYYVYEDGTYKNNWGNAGDASYNAAHNAFVNLYELFGKDGSLHGGLVEEDYYDKTTISSIWRKNAFMGIINIPASVSGVIEDDSLGVLPLSGLFASSGSNQANQIPVHTLGFQFRKAENVSLVQIAAAAKFVDYVSKNSLQFAEKGWYPLRKSVVQSDAFINSSNSTVTFLKQVGNPENFRTLDGNVNEKTIFNAIGAEGNVVPLLGISNVTAKDLETSVAYLKRKITYAMN